MTCRKTIAAALALCPWGAQADITSATLYPSHAEVTWEEIRPVAAGPGILEIDNLPVSLQAQGLQVKLEGLAGATIQQVQVDRVERAGFVAAETRRLKTELADLDQRIQADKDDISGWQQQVDLMARATGHPQERTASELEELAQAAKDTTQQALRQIREIRQVMAEAVAERDRLKRELAQVRQTARAAKRVEVRYEALAAGELTAILRFQTPEAGWRSEYNARLATALEDRPGGEITLEHLAVVRQTTGTDWQGVELRLSTANARRGTVMPEPTPWVVRTGSPSTYGKSVGRAQSDMLMESAAPSSAAVVERQSSFTQSYRLTQPVDLPSGREGQRLAVATHLIPAEVASWTTPVLDPTAYLHATGTFEAEAPVPAGPATLYRDGQSVGRATLPDLADGEALSLGFGVDEGVRVKVVNELEKTGEEGIWTNENVQRRQNRFEITNHHQGGIMVKVFDRLPVSQQDKLTVKPLEITEPVDRNVDDKKGVLAWLRLVPSGETLAIQSGFEVRVPEGHELPRL